MQGQYNMRSPAVKRLMKEAQELQQPTELYHAQPLEDNLFEWHFTLRGPEESDFEGGIYHGRIILPPEYPMKPPSIILLTPNGRFETFKKICLSISGHHPESWQPSWSIRTALLAIIGFMPTHGGGAIGSLDYTPEERKVLSKKSQDWKCSDCGDISKKLKPLTKASEKASQEAKELAAQIDFQGEKAGGSPAKPSDPATADQPCATCTSKPSDPATPEQTLTASLLSKDPTAVTLTSTTSTTITAPYSQGQPPFPFSWPMPPGWGNFPPQKNAMTNPPIAAACTVPRFPYPPPAMMPPPVAAGPGMPFYPPLPFFPPMFRGLVPFPGQPGTVAAGPVNSPLMAAGPVNSPPVAAGPATTNAGFSQTASTTCTSSPAAAQTPEDASNAGTSQTASVPEMVGAAMSSRPPPAKGRNAALAAALMSGGTSNSASPDIPASTSGGISNSASPDIPASTSGGTSNSVSPAPSLPTPPAAAADTEFRRRTAVLRQEGSAVPPQTAAARTNSRFAVNPVGQFFGSYSSSSIVMMIILLLAITLLLCRRIYLQYFLDFSGRVM